MNEIFAVGDKVRGSMEALDESNRGQVFTLASYIEPNSDPALWECTTEAGQTVYLFPWELECLDPIKELRRRLAAELEECDNTAELEECDNTSAYMRGKAVAFNTVADWLADLLPEQATKAHFQGQFDLDGDGIWVNTFHVCHTIQTARKILQLLHDKAAAHRIMLVYTIVAATVIEGGESN